LGPFRKKNETRLFVFSPFSFFFVRTPLSERLEQTTKSRVAKREKEAPGYEADGILKYPVHQFLSPNFIGFRDLIGTLM